MIRISPMIVTKMSRVPSLGSIGEAWVRMCSMPAAHSSAYCAYHGRAAARADQTEAERAQQPDQNLGGQHRAAADPEPAEHDAGAADEADQQPAEDQVAAVHGQRAQRDGGQGDRDHHGQGAHARLALRSGVGVAHRIVHWSSAAADSCSSDDQASATLVPRRTSITRHWLSRRICPASSCWARCCSRAGLVGEGVHVHEHGHALRPVAARPEQGVGVLGRHPAHDRDRQLTGSVDGGRLHGVVHRRGRAGLEVGQPADHQLGRGGAVLAHACR